MVNFSQIANRAIANNPIMEGREKVSTNVIIAEHPDFVTVIGFDFAKGSQGEFAVCLLAEYPNRYYPGGMCVTNICREWITEYQGDIGQCNKDLKDSGGCKMKLEMVRTKANNQFVKVTLV